MPKVSVIVPIYNAEKYIEKCVRSLFEQTLDDIEYIFVNDCTPDNSMQILKNIIEEYPHRKTRIKILNHVQNQGQAGARTTGMKAMTGEFMIHCDPDDWVDLDLYEKMYYKAINSKSDIVICDFDEIYDNYTTKISTTLCNNNSKLVLKNYYKYPICPALWNKLIKSDIIKTYNIYPFEGINIGEDLNIFIRVLHFAKLVSTIHNAKYYYVINPNSSTNSISNKIKWDKYIFNNVVEICLFLNKHDIDNYKLTSLHIKYHEKQYLLKDKYNRQLYLWYKTWRDSHKIIKYYNLSTKQYLIELLIQSCYPCLILYYKYIDFRHKNQ